MLPIDTDMSLNESIVEDAVLIMPGASLTRLLPAREENREAIPEAAQAVVSILENTAAICDRSTP